MKIILLGPPGAGKGTQAQVLKENLGLVHLSTGDIFRNLIKSGSDFGMQIKQYVESGALVPDDIVVAVVADEIRKMDLTKGFVLDGFPRTRQQAEMLNKTLRELRIAVDRVFYFDTTENMIIQRLSGRRICSKCGATYHVINMPPKTENVCDACGSKLLQRKDDNKETVINRLNVYKEQTEDLITYYKELNLLDKINGDLSKDEAFNVLQEKLLSLSN